MCGRYNLRATPAELQEYFDLVREWEAMRSPRYNIAPTQSVAAVRLSAEGREPVWFRWGLIPSWSKELQTHRPLFNARAETVDEKPSFRAAFKKRRCLIPATGFYEWKKTGPKTKQPFHIHRKDDGPFALAGLWERWDKGSEPVESCTIITTAANHLMSTIHDRMPVILHPEDYDLWLDPEFGDHEKLRSMLEPYSGNDLEAYPVNETVNNSRNDVEECVQGIS